MQKKKPILKFAFLFVSLACLIHINLQLWTNQTDDIVLQWMPNHQLTIVEVKGNNSIVVEPGTNILSIDAKRPIRSRPYINVVGQAQSFDFVIVEDGQAQEVELILSKASFLDVMSFMLPIGVVTFSFWLVGAITAILSDKNRYLNGIAYTFIGIGLILSGIQGELEGVWGAWVFGKVFVFLLPCLFLYLSFFPRRTQLMAKHQIPIATLGIVGVVLAAIGAYEVLVLFPRMQSFELSGVGLSGLALLGVVFSGGMFALVLFIRLVREANPFIKRQLGIVLGAGVLAVTPAIFLGIIPLFVARDIFAPVPILIIFLAIIPFSYLYIIFRHKFLGIEIIVSKSVHVLITLLITSIIFIILLYMIEFTYQVDLSSILGLLLIAVFINLILGFIISRPLNLMVWNLLYGETDRNYVLLSQFTNSVSKRPDQESIKEVVHEISILYDVQKYALLTFDNAITVTFNAVIDASREEIELIKNQPSDFLARDAVFQDEFVALLNRNEWCHLIIPLRSDEHTLGILFLGKPAVQEAFYYKQIEFILKVSKIVALGIQLASLFSYSKELSRKSILLEQIERQKLASSIHDSPLQEMAYVINVLDRHNTKGGGVAELQESAHLLRQISRELRDICAGLSPAWGVSIKEKIQWLVSDFEKSSDIQVDVQIVNQIDDQDLDAETVNAIFHIVAESLNNIRKHSQASSATISLKISGDTVALEIHDNGVGLPAPNNNRLIDLLNSRHFGLAGMFEWARMANSELSIFSPPNKGTMILLEKKLA